MHSLHYKNLPFTLSAYCKQPEHRYSTRYRTASNYVLPCPTSNRSQGSIKFSGPKAWADVPKHLKDVAFRKPFSKKHKEYILKQTHVEMPPKRRNNTVTEIDEVLNLNILFETDDENDEFFGFDISMEVVNRTFSDLRQLFDTSSSDEDFAGFSSSDPRNTDLNVLFLNDSNTDEFFGF